MALKVTKAEVWSAMLVRPRGWRRRQARGARHGRAPTWSCIRAPHARAARQRDPVRQPVKGAKATRAAQEAGLAEDGHDPLVRIEGGDKPGLGAKTARALGMLQSASAA